MILSNHMKNFAMLENGTNWGLHVANRDAHFKVLGQVTYKGKTGIFLLHLPDDETWKAYQTMEFSLDKELYEKAVSRFQAKALDAPDSGAGCQGVAGSLSVSGRNERRGTVLAIWRSLPEQWQDPAMPDLSACLCEKRRGTEDSLLSGFCIWYPV